MNFDNKISDCEIQVYNLVYMKNLDIQIGKVIADVMIN